MLDRVRGRTPPVPDVRPDKADIYAKLKATKARIHALATERHSLALQVLSNDEAAIARVKEIDTERTELVSREETLSSAIDQLRHIENDPLERQRRGFATDLPRIASNLKIVVDDRIGSLSRHVARICAGEPQEAAHAWQGVLHHPTANYRSSEIATPEQLIDRLKREAAVDPCYVQGADAPEHNPYITDQTAYGKRREGAIALRKEMISKLVEAAQIKPPAHLVQAYKQLVAALQRWE